MNKDNGFAYQVLVLLVIIIIAVAGVIINKVIGRNGVINQVTKVESNYNKEDVLEKINSKITQKFIELNKTAEENGQSISDLYNEEVVIEYLKQNIIIEEIRDENDEVIPDVYLINPKKLYEEDEKVDIAGVFKLEKIDGKYMVVFYDGDDNREEVGELIIQQI